MLSDQTKIRGYFGLQENKTKPIPSNPMIGILKIPSQSQQLLC